MRTSQAIVVQESPLELEAPLTLEVGEGSWHRLALIGTHPPCVGEGFRRYRCEGCGKDVWMLP